MGIFPVAPRIQVRLPRVIHAGDSVLAQITIDAREDVTLDWIRARLDTVEKWEIGAGESSSSWRRELLSLHTELFAGGVLAAGSHDHRARFDLPAGLPPSTTMGAARVETLLHVEASIPWWPDARASYVVPVYAAPQPLHVGPLRATNQATGAGMPRVELSLASRSVAARGVISGAVACIHHDARALEGASLTLRCATRVAPGNRAYTDGGSIAFTIPLPRAIPSDGTPVPFRARVPDAAVPGYRTPGIEIQWTLCVERPKLFGTTTWIAVPIEIVETGSENDPGEGLEVPPIGDARVERALASVASSLGLRVDRAALVGESGAVSFRIERSVEVDVGTSLVATLALPRLGLGLRVSRAHRLASLLQGDVEVGHPELDRAHRVEARDPAQARAFFAGLADVLGDGSLRWLDDERAVLAQPDATLDERSMTAFARRTTWAARELDRAIAEIVPPSGVHADAQAWHDVARTLGGRAVIGDLSIEGRAGESAVTIATSLDAREHTIRVRPSPAIPDDVELSLFEPRTAQVKSLGPALAALPERARDLEIARGEARMRLPLELEDGVPRADPGAALRAVTVLARLGTLLAPARGPFR